MSNLYFKFLDYLISRSPFLHKPLPSYKGPRDSFTNAVNLASDVVRLVLKRVPHTVPALVLKRSTGLHTCSTVWADVAIRWVLSSILYWALWNTWREQASRNALFQGATAARETTRIS